MTHSPTPEELTALRVAEAALLTADSAYGFASTIVFALGAAQLLQSPETAAELARLRARVDEVDRLYTFDTAKLRARVAELEAERSRPATVLAPEMGPGQQRLAERTMSELEATHCQRLGLTPPAPNREDPHDSPLHHTYAKGRDLPRASGACTTCGDGPTAWCPDCAACRAGCHGGHDSNPCAHPNAPWAVSRG